MIERCLLAREREREREYIIINKRTVCLSAWTFVSIIKPLLLRMMSLQGNRPCAGLTWVRDRHQNLEREWGVYFVYDWTIWQITHHSYWSKVQTFPSRWNTQAQIVHRDFTDLPIVEYRLHVQEVFRTGERWISWRQVNMIAGDAGTR